MNQFDTKAEPPQHFASGATRSDTTGKGRFDLITPWLYLRIASADRTDLPLPSIEESAVEQAVLFLAQCQVLNDYDYVALAAECLLRAMHFEDGGSIVTLGGGALRLSPIGLRRLALVYERGAKIRGDRNWEKGFDLSRCLDSARRHISQWIARDREEDHLAQATWNLAALMHFQECIDRGLLPVELDNIPDYGDKPLSNQKKIMFRAIQAVVREHQAGA